MDKKIKESKRGLTFSFTPTETMQIGSRYDYIISNSGIRIVPSKTGRYTVSRKRSGSGWNPLIDLRNREVLDAIAGMENIRLHITADSILVSGEAEHAVVLQFPRTLLAQARKVVGISDSCAVSRILEGTQITLDEYLASSKAPLDIAAIQKDLPDIYSVVSLFSGAGILDWPFFKDERFSIQYAIDYDAGACQTYRQNIGMHIVHGDVHKAFTAEGFPLDNTVKAPDVIVGGPSCKPFSNANRHTRLEDHPDSDLLMQYMRIVETLNPKVFAIENVPEVLTACGGSYYAAVREKAESFGYELDSGIVQDCKVGGYTTRKRAVILGSRIGTPKLADITLAGKYRTAGDAISKVDASWSNYGDVSKPSPEVEKRMSFVPQGGNYTAIPEEYRTESKNRHSCTYRRLAWNEPSPTIVNKRHNFALILSYHADKDSHEYAGLARKEEHERILSLRGKSVRREPSSHPLREGAERIEIYLKAPRHPANHNSDAWDSGDEAKTLDCNIPKRLSLPTEALAAALCKTMKYCVFPGSSRTPALRGRATRENSGGTR